ncbi:hypothetical protein BDC45DRAFT_534534 [Circinella umbellata]|nr:hypothetical protein BDC45DRAFT_534534 [Circinella umbellata]
MTLARYQEDIIYTNVFSSVCVGPNKSTPDYLSSCYRYPNVDNPATLSQNSYQCLQVHLRQRTMNLYPNTRDFCPIRAILRIPKTSVRAIPQRDRNVHLPMIGVCALKQKRGRTLWRLPCATHQNHKAPKTPKPLRTR